MNLTKIKEGIVYTKNGDVQNPIDLNRFLIATKFIFSFIGIPLNLFLAIIIIRLRRLHSKPRNIFLLGIFFSNLLIFVIPIIELLYWIHPDEVMCQAYVSVIPLPYAILLLNILSAQIDRYIAITYPLWHRKKATVAGVCCYLFLSSTVLILLTKFVYIFKILPLQCDFRILHGQIAGGIIVILFISCFVFHVILYHRNREILKASQPAEPTGTTTNVYVSHQGQHHQEEFASPYGVGRIEATQEEPTTKKENTVAYGDASRNHSTTNPTSFISQVANGTLNKMEMEATRALITGVLSLFILATPPILFFFAFLCCSLLFESECISSFGWLAPYIKEFGLVHAVYNPIVYMYRNEELWSVLKSKFKSGTTVNN